MEEQKTTRKLKMKTKRYFKAFVLNIFHKAKAKTLANEWQQTWTNQFRSWLSKNTAYGPIINFPGKLYEVNVGTCVYV